ncbi:MAG: hypothetical protein ABFC73_04580 [Clostridiaceae bacterium]
MEEKGLIPAFRDSLLNPTLVSSVIDLAEIGFDTIVLNGVLQELPVVKTLVGVGKFAYSVRERNLLKLTLRFIAHIHDGTISSTQFEKYRTALYENPRKAEQELSRVLILLDRFIDDEKEKILAAFFRAYIQGLINWGEFCELSDALDRLFISDIRLLYRIVVEEARLLYEQGGYSADRLVSVGLVNNPTYNIKIDFGGFPPFGKIPLSLTKLGKIFIQYCDIEQE